MSESKSDSSSPNDPGDIYTAKDLRQSYLAGAYDQMVELLSANYFSSSAEVLTQAVKHIDSLHDSLVEEGVEFTKKADPKVRADFDALIEGFVNQPKKDFEASLNDGVIGLVFGDDLEGGIKA